MSFYMCSCALVSYTSRVFVSFFFFFFKQKTAYEMRISDWSSDVCSSDLWHRVDRRLADRQRQARLGDRADAGAGLEDDTAAGRRAAQRCLHGGEVSHIRVIAGILHDGGAGRVVGPGLDRESVVSGKSVSVRVDLGGRPFIKKKKQRQIQ